MTDLRFVRRCLALTFSVLCLALSVSCHAPTTDVLHYEAQENWAYLAPNPDKAVDVFLLGPTVDMGADGRYQITTLDGATKDGFVGLLNMERGIYEDTAVLYAPYYRQMTFAAYTLPDARRKIYRDAAFEDVAAAWEYYFDHYNEGRPVILAGFSQGAEMALLLLKEYFDDPKYQEQLVAAYCIGWRLTEEDLAQYPHLQAAKGETDLGSIVSFNCEAEGVGDSLLVPKGVRTVGINPLNWKTDAAPADRNLNLGACFTDTEGNIFREVPP